MSWNGVKIQTNNADIEAWCEEMGIENYTINDKGEIDVDGDVLLQYKGIRELPYKFDRVSGDFDIGYNEKLISLKNCPYYVGKYFACNRCIELDSLEGCPKEVGSKFYCRICKRKFTEEEVKSLCKVKKDIWC